MYYNVYMDDREMDQKEQELITSGEVLSPSQISLAEADSTLNRLMYRYTGDEKYLPVTGQGEENEENKESEDGHPERLRGGLIPLAASAAGIGAGFLFNSEAYKIGKIASEMTGAASPIFKSLSVLEKISPPVIATVGAGISSLVATGINRVFGENIFQFASKYSHLNAESEIIPWPIEKAWTLYSRGLEHAAFNAYIVNPANPDVDVIELIESSKALDFADKIKEMGRDKFESLIANGYWHLVSTEATKFYGAEFDDAEREKIVNYTKEVRSAIDKFKAQVPAEQRQEFEKNVYDRVVNMEKMRYLLATGLTSSISALKAFAFGWVFETVHDYILPFFFPNLKLEPQPQEVRVEVRSQVTQPSMVQTEVPQGLPGIDLDPAIRPLEEADMARSQVWSTPPKLGGGSSPMPVPAEVAQVASVGVNNASDTEIVPNWLRDVTPPQTAQPEFPKIEFNVADLDAVRDAGSVPELEVIGLEKAVETLPTISPSGVIDSAETLNSPILSLDQGLDLLKVVAAENPAVIEQAVAQIKNSPDIVEDTKDVIGSLGTSAFEIIRQLQSAGPAGQYIVNKIFQLGMCGASIPSGGMACPVLAGP